MIDHARAWTAAGAAASPIASNTGMAAAAHLFQRQSRYAPAATVAIQIPRVSLMISAVPTTAAQGSEIQRLFLIRGANMRNAASRSSM